MFEYKAPEQLLKDKTILVTGAGDGIGATAAKTFAAHGATVILLGRTTKKLEAVYDQIESAGHPQPAIYPMNLEGAVGKDYEDMANTIEQEFGQLDGILHNAAVLGALMPIHQYDMELWQRCMQVNLTAPYLMTRLLLPLLNKAPSASVIFTSDKVAQQGKAYWGGYGVSKAAADNLMEIFADEFEKNTQIRFNSIDPGVVATKLRAKAYPGENPGKLTQTKDVMPAYLYLMGDDSHDINGQIFKAQD